MQRRERAVSNGQIIYLKHRFLLVTFKKFKAFKTLKGKLALFCFERLSDGLNYLNDLNGLNRY
jgi:hypothetical protein